jgi:hypothetical protein
MRMFPKIATAAWLVGVLVFSARDAAANQIGYAVESLSSELGNLYSVDLTTATATLIGPTVPVLDGLAISPDTPCLERTSWETYVLSTSIQERLH